MHRAKCILLRQTGPSPLLLSIVTLNASAIGVTLLFNFFFGLMVRPGTLPGFGQLMMGWPMWANLLVVWLVPALGNVGIAFVAGYLYLRGKPGLAHTFSIFSLAWSAGTIFGWMAVV